LLVCFTGMGVALIACMNMRASRNDTHSGIFGLPKLLGVDGALYLWR
jgi:hypothetical protein